MTLWCAVEEQSCGFSEVLWLMLVIPIVGRLKQEDCHGLEARLKASKSVSQLIKLRFYVVHQALSTRHVQLTARELRSVPSDGCECGPAPHEMFFFTREPVSPA